MDQYRCTCWPPCYSFVKNYSTIQYTTTCVFAFYQCYFTFNKLKALMTCTAIGFNRAPLPYHNKSNVWSRAMHTGNIHNICSIKEGTEYSSINDSPYRFPNNTQYMQPKSWLNTYCLLPQENIMLVHRKWTVLTNVSSTYHGYSSRPPRLASPNIVYNFHAPVDIKLPYCPPNFPQFNCVVDRREP